MLRFDTTELNKTARSQFGDNESYPGGKSNACISRFLNITIKTLTACCYYKTHNSKAAVSRH